MKNKTLLLDIDDTIYDVAKAKLMFEKALSKKLNLKASYLADLINGSYKDLKEKVGYYNPSSYVDILAKKLLTSKSKIQQVSWDEEKFVKCIYNETSRFIQRIYKKFDILIFSTGDKKFQSKKLKTIKKYISNKNIYIYKNKTTKLKSLINKLKNKDIFIIDDSPEVINKAKEINKNIHTILIKRRKYNKNYNYSGNILADYKVKNLMSAVKIIE